MHQYKGKLILHTGSMFSGKTSSLWKDLNRFEIAKYETVVFKPKFDNRYADKEIVTHDNNKMRAIPVETAEAVENIDEIIEYMKTSTASIIGIDEVQFIKGDINKIVEFYDWLSELPQGMAGITEEIRNYALQKVDMCHVMEPIEEYIGF